MILGSCVRLRRGILTGETASTDYSSDLGEFKLDDLPSESHLILVLGSISCFVMLCYLFSLLFTV